MSDLDATLRFLQRLISTPSLPGSEAAIARLVMAEMQELGYPEVHLDDVGNVVGRVPGRGEAPPLMFNTHLDHVDVGDHANWPHPPFGGEIHGGKVWGRGAVDIKGPMAAQVYGVARLLREQFRPAGDILVTAVVQEEVGGLGARHLARTLDAPWVVVGEPSRNTLRRGHRGRCELLLRVFGRSVHASVPQEGISPYPTLAEFLRGLEDLDMREDPDLGPSSIAPTLIASDQTSANVVPAELILTCDWRNVPGETAEDVRALLQELADRSVRNGARAEVSVPIFEATSYTGVVDPIPADNPAYVLRIDHPLVEAARYALEDLIGDEEPGFWKFATDGGHFALAGMAPLGFGPGDELLAHTVQEHIEVEALELALRGNELLARHLPEAAKSSSSGS